MKQSCRRIPAVSCLFTSLAVILGAATPTSLTGEGNVGELAQRVERVWPDPPAPPRVRFLRSLSPQTSSVRRSFFRKLWDVVSGGRESAVMAQPYGVTMGPSGKLYVADTAGHAIHIYDVRTGDYARLVVDAESLVGVTTFGGRLFVTDSVGGRVICLNLAGRKQWAIGPEAGLQRPTGIVAAGDQLHVIDTLAHQVVTLSADGRVLGHFGSRGGEPGQFNYPTNIARDGAGRLYVTDSMNFRVQIFTPQGRYVSSFGQLGDGSGDFNRPKGVGVDSDGHVYVVEGLHDVVQIFDRDGRFLLAFGEPGHSDGEFWLATGIAIVADQIYVADSANGRVQVFEYLKEEP